MIKDFDVNNGRSRLAKIPSLTGNYSLVKALNSVQLSLAIGARHDAHF
ncbi:hypothetical protein [Limimaricola soesokkakensis]